MRAPDYRDHLPPGDLPAGGFSAGDALAGDLPGGNDLPFGGNDLPFGDCEGLLIERRRCAPLTNFVIMRCALNLRERARTGEPIRNGNF
eukprot:6208723-Pleurochrysis_carterae.AAC.2